MDYDYLLCSDVFAKAEYYIIQGHEDNYKHLTGVETDIKASDFFNRCYEGTLSEDDFRFEKNGHSEAEVKGAVREKIRVLSDISNVFSANSTVEEGFHKNAIKCSFAVEGCTFTLGFTCKDRSKPMTLLRGKRLDQSKAGAMDLVLRKQKAEKKYNEIVVGDECALKKYGVRIKELPSEDLARCVSIEENNDD